jgi:dolichol-phosphate mannosyltransferase
MIPETLSIVIPFLNEEGAAAEVIGDVIAALAGFEFEIVAIDDGSTDRTPSILAALASANGRIRVLSHSRRVGQSSAIRTGVRAARHEWIATLDGDGQNPPDQLPRMLAALADPGAEHVGMVQGQRIVRQDSLSKQWASHIANRIRAAILRDGVRDSGCGLKLFRRSAYLDLPFFDHIHRFMPVMMMREGWQVRLVDVSHRARETGQSKYSNLHRALVGVSDLIGVAWLIKRQDPLASRPRQQSKTGNVGGHISRSSPQEQTYGRETSAVTSPAFTANELT